MEILLEKIQETAFNYFNDYTNKDYNSKGFGLTVDNTKQLDRASIASTGFTLSSYIIADKYNYLNKEELIKRVIGTLKTLYYNVEHYEGFFAHFVNINTGKKYGKTEYSTIDTALAVNGILACEMHFKNDEISKYSKLIIERINWKEFFHMKDNKLCLYMAYNDDENGDYANGTAGFIHHWGMFAEQLMMYVLIAADDRYKQSDALSLYNGFERVVGKYDDHEFIYSPGNTLFIYQYPLAWFDLKDIIDDNGISWFNNAKQATLAQYKWSTSGNHNFKTYGSDFYGLTASNTPTGYQVFSGLPNINNKIITDGTVASNAIIGSLPFIPQIALHGIEQMYKIDGLWDGKYGFKDAFNFENEKWISEKFITIDKGLELLMVNAYLTKDVQSAYMNHPIIIKGMERLKWKKAVNGGKKL